MSDPMWQATIRALQPDVTPVEYTLADSCTIGRAPECTIVVSRETVSRFHAQIVRQGRVFLLSDIGSSNGTFVNGSQIFGPHQLRHLDMIGLAVGGNELQFHDGGATVIKSRILHYQQREQQFVYRSQPLDLSPNLTRLLMHLYTHSGAVCNHASCVQAIWGETRLEPERLSALHKEISELREKFEAIDPTTEVIRTRRGVGYFLFLES